MKGGLGVTPLLAKVLIRSLDGFQVSCPLALAVLARNLQQKIPGLSRSSSMASHQSRFRSTYPRLDHAPDQIGKKGRNHPKG